MTQTKLAFNQTNGNVVSVLDYGAVGDDSTDNTTALQACINENASVRAILIPYGIYRTGALTIPDGKRIIIFGNSRRSCVLRYTASTGDMFSAIGRSDESEFYNFKIDHVDGAPAASGAANGSSGTAISFDVASKNQSDISIQRMSISGFKNMVTISNQVTCVVRDIKRGTGTSVFDGSTVHGTGIYFKNNGLSSNQGYVENVYLSNYDIPIKSDASPTIIRGQNTLEYYGTAGVENNASGGSGVTNAEGLYFFSPAAFNPVSMVKESGSGYFKAEILQTNEPRDSLPCDDNSATNGRMIIVTNKSDNIIAHLDSDQVAADATTSYITNSDWATVALNKDSAPTSTKNYAEDTESQYNTTTYTYTTKYPGRYRLGAQVCWDCRNTGFYSAAIVKGADITTGRIIESPMTIDAVTGGVDLRTISLSPVTVNLSAGDTIQLRFYNNSGASQTIKSSRGNYNHELSSGTPTSGDPPHLTFLSIDGPLN